MQQGGWAGDLLTLTNWQMVVRKQILPLDWPLVMEDVGSFIIDSEGDANFSKEQLLALLE